MSFIDLSLLLILQQSQVLGHPQYLFHLSLPIICRYITKAKVAAKYMDP